MATILADIDFEGGTVGQAVSEADTNNWWTAVYTAAVTKTGTRGCRIGYSDSGGYGGSFCYQPWVTNAYTGPAYIRAYVMLTSLAKRAGSPSLGTVVASFGFGLGGAVVHSDGSVSVTRNVDGNYNTGVGGSNRTPAGVVTANTLFRVELYSTGAASGTTTMRLFVGSNIDGATPDYTKVSNTANDAYYGTQYAGIANAENIPDGEYIYADRVAFATDGWIGPVILTTTATSDNVSSLGVSGVVSKNASVSMVSSSNLAVSPIIPKVAAVSMASISTIADLGWFDAKDYMTGGAGTWGVGVVNLRGLSADQNYRIIASAANLQNLTTRGLNIFLPRPANVNTSHTLNFEITVKDAYRRVFFEISTGVMQRWNDDKLTTEGISTVRQDGWIVECSEVNNSKAYITMHWDTNKKMWYYGAYSGDTQVIDHRPNEMPPDLVPLYFSQAFRARPTFQSFRDTIVSDFVKLPYWIQRFMSENTLAIDIIDSINDVGQCLGLRHSVDPTVMSGINGLSVPPWSIAAGDGASHTALHEMGHLFDMLGLPYAGHPYGYRESVGFWEPLTVPALAGNLWQPVTLGGIEPALYWDPPNNTKLKYYVKLERPYDPSQPVCNCLYLRSEDGSTDTLIEIGQLIDPHIRTTKRAIAEYNALTNRPGSGQYYDGNYYRSNITEWVAQCIAQYFENIIGKPYYPDNEGGTGVVSTPSMTAYLYELGIFPFMDALKAIETLTVNGTVYTPLQQASVASSNVSTLGVTAATQSTGRPQYGFFQFF